MKRVSAIAMLIMISGCAFERTTKEDFESELTDSLADSLHVVSEASDVGTVGPNFGGVDELCSGTPQVNAQAPICSSQYPSDVTVTWSCVGPDGNGASGTAEVETVFVPNQCPLVVATSIAATQTMSVGKQWRLGRVVANLTGTAALDWSNAPGEPASRKNLSVDLTHQVSRRDKVVRHQHVVGSRAILLDENGEGPADDTRTVDGAIDIDFLLADVHAEITETDLTFRRGCCHPISGEIAYTLSGGEERSGSIIFGPRCGAAETDTGRVLDLAPCVGD